MKIILFAFSFILSTACYSQEINVGFGYNYLYSKQYDQLIQTYNFSRPNLLEKQPLLENGFGINANYFFKSDNNIQSGINLDYSLFSSKAQNPDHLVELSLNLFQLGYALRLQSQEKLKNFYADVSLNAVLGLLNKKIDGKPYLVDDSRINSVQVGTSLHTDIGYLIQITDRLKLSPFIGFGYSPYFTEGKSEIVINQTSGIMAEDYNSFLSMSAGVKLHFSH